MGAGSAAEADNRFELVAATLRESDQTLVVDQPEDGRRRGLGAKPNMVWFIS